MPEIIGTIEGFRKFVNEKGIMEIVVRGQGQRIKQFQKVILQDSSQTKFQEQVKEVLQVLNQSKELGEQAIKKAEKLENLSQLQMILSVLNLGVTVAGFAIVSKELTDISGKIEKMLSVIKSSNGIQLNYELGKILSEHSDMLNKRNLQSNYSEDKMRELVDDECNVLSLLVEAFLKDITDDREKLVFSIYSMASMLTTSIIYFDEIYFFNHKDNVVEGQNWHLSHEKWVSVLDKLTSNEYISKIQDFGFFELGLDTFENDCYYKSLYDQIMGFKESISDNQTLLQVFETEKEYHQYHEMNKQDIKESIIKSFDDAGISMDNPEIADMLNSVFEKIAIA